MSAYTRTTYHGKTLNKRTVAMIQEAEKRLGYDLTILQGSYNAGGVSASAGTHDGGGAVDLAPYDWQTKVRVLRNIGFAAWHRPAIAGLWSEHIHAIAIGDKEMSDGARRQVSAYYAGRDGLASNAPDNFYRPSPIPVFVYNFLVARRVSKAFRAENPKPLLGVKMVQRALNKRGYHLAVDGIAGSKTKAAFKKWSGGALPNIKNLTRLGKGRFRVRK